MPAGFSPPPLWLCLALPSFLTVGSRPRLVRTLPTRPPPLPLPSPRSHVRSRVPAHPPQKTQVQCGRSGGFLPWLPFTLFPSFLLYLSLNLFPSLPPTSCWLLPLISPLFVPRFSLLPSTLPAFVPLTCPVSSCYTYASTVRSRVRRPVSLHRVPENHLSLAPAPER